MIVDIDPGFGDGIVFLLESSGLGLGLGISEIINIPCI